MATMPSRVPPRRRRSTTPRTERVDLEIMPDVRSLIDHAAEVTGKKRSDFILDAARVAAETALLDRRTIALNGKA